MLLYFEADNIRRLPFGKLDLARRGEGFRWLHLAGDRHRVREWLQDNSPLDTAHADALCGDLTRPRLFVDGERNLTLTLRSARAKPEAPLEYPSLRVRADSRQLISISLQPTELLGDLLRQLRVEGRSIVSTGQVLLELVRRMTLDFTREVHALDSAAESLEDDWEENRSIELEGLVPLRGKVSRLTPLSRPPGTAVQRCAEELTKLQGRPGLWASGTSAWRGVINWRHRDLEALGKMRERVTILSDTLQTEQ